MRRKENREWREAQNRPKDPDEYLKRLQSGEVTLRLLRYGDGEEKGRGIGR